MRKHAGGATILLLALATALIAVNNLANRSIDEEKSEVITCLHPYNIDLYQGAIFRQEFIPSLDNLQRIGVFAVNVYPDQGGKLSLSFFDGTSKIASRYISVDQLVVRRYSQLFFNPINNSQNKKYLIELESDVSADTPLSIAACKNDNLPVNLYRQETLLPERLNLIAAYKNNGSESAGWSGLNVYLDRLSQYKPEILKGKIILILSLVYLFLAFLYLYLYNKLKE